MANEVKSPENQPQFPQMTMGLYWLGKTTLSGGPEMLSKSCHGIKKQCLTEFSTDPLTD